jgi:hypothetical protein
MSFQPDGAIIPHDKVFLVGIGCRPDAETCAGIFLPVLFDAFDQSSLHIKVVFVHSSLEQSREEECTTKQTSRKELSACLDPQPRPQPRRG